MIIEYEDKYLEDVRDLLVELEEYIVSIVEDNLDIVSAAYREKMALVDLEEIKNNWNVGEMRYPFGNGINISMTVSDIDSFYESIISKKVVLFRKIKTSKYRVDDIIYEDKEFLLQDPDGYLLRFNN